MNYVHALFIATGALYLFLWAGLFVRIDFKYLKTIRNILMFLILPPFWFVFLIMVIDINMSIATASEEQKVILDNSQGKQEKCLILEKRNNSGKWIPSYRIRGAKHTPFIDLSPGQIDTCKFESVFTEHMFACISIDDSENFSNYRGKVFNKTGKPIYINMNELGNNGVRITNISHSHEIHRLIFFALAILGCWYHVFSFKDKEMRIKGILGAAAITVLCVYLSSKFITTIFFFMN